jgi:hypothetical protein
MQQFQLLSTQMVNISQQSKRLKAKTLAKWFNIMLDDND